MPQDPKVVAYQDVMHLVGSIWRSVGDERRAALAFAASGREAQREEAVRLLHQSGDWNEEARVLEESGQSRNAARLHERNKSYVEAARLFEKGADVRAALRCLLAARDNDGARRLMASLPPDQMRPILEKAKAYELLMEAYVAAKDFEGVARLYERARQFDQAALAWEGAGKFSLARKAYERARDAKGASRMRDREVEHLLGKGDRLGAALSLAASGERKRAEEVLLQLPALKAYRFLQRAKMDDEALALARREIDRAQSEGKQGDRARWLELTGEWPQAAEAWELASRKDRALAAHEQLGNWQRAAELAEAIGNYPKAVELFHRAGDKANADRVASLPPPAPVPAPPSDEAEPDESVEAGKS